MTRLIPFMPFLTARVVRNYSGVSFQIPERERKIMNQLTTSSYQRTRWLTLVGTIITQFALRSVYIYGLPLFCKH